MAWLRLFAVAGVLVMGSWRAHVVSAGRSMVVCVQPQASHEAAMSVAGNGWTYLYQGTPLARLWRWTGSAWVHAVTASTPGILSPTMAPDPSGSGLILVGVTGVGADHRVHLGMWRWQGGRWSRLHPPALPSAGFFQIELSLAEDRVHQMLLLAETVSNADYAVHTELWSWDGTTWKRVAADKPDQITGSTVPTSIAMGPGGAVYGFLGTNVHVTRLVRWNGSALQPVHVAGGPSAVAGMTTDPDGGALVVLGGAQSPVPDTPFTTSATYRFDGSRWGSRPLPHGLQNWVQMALAPEPKHHDVLLWGGQRSYGFVKRPPAPPAFPATWQWSGRRWVERQAACKVRRYGSSWKGGLS